MKRFAPDAPVRVLLVESMRSLRHRLSDLIAAAPGLTLVGVAAKDAEAVEVAASLRPDVIAINAEVYGSDGFAVTRQVMRRCPCPVVMYAATVTPALEAAASAAGALTVMQAPRSQSDVAHERDCSLFLQTLRVMAGVPVVTRFAGAAPAPVATAAAPGQTYELLAIAASTGGPGALQRVIGQLGPDFPLPIVVVQHIARNFIHSLAEWLGSVTPLPIDIVGAEQRLRPGHLYLAPSNHHLLVQRRGWVTAQDGDEAPAAYCPSADILLHSVAQTYGRRAIGLILSGMGDDGARGLAALRRAGGLTLAQDEASCVVYGMPQAAVQQDAVQQVVPLNDLASVILQHCAGR